MDYAEKKAQKWGEVQGVVRAHAQEIREKYETEWFSSPPELRDQERQALETTLLLERDRVRQLFESNSEGGGLDSWVNWEWPKQMVIEILGLVKKRGWK
ncbi:MAG: hypothetical protein V1487_01845 [bacterium]